jgi:Zn-dependent peptidase ImmA (M78 family)
LREACDIFDVNLEMMLYRLQELKLLPREDAQSEFGW